MEDNLEITDAKYAHYLRVSTAKQGIDGFGIDAQRVAIARYVPAAEFLEVESGKRKDRPELLRALEFCKKDKAVLVVAKLDRLARNVAFVSMLMESGVEFVCADFPTANRLTIHVLSAVAEHEASMISSRTKAGLAAAKAKGVALGKTMDAGRRATATANRSTKADDDAAKVIDTINSLRAGGSTLQRIADQLNNMGVATPRGKRWTPMAVRNAQAREIVSGGSATGCGPFMGKGLPFVS